MRLGIKITVLSVTVAASLFWALSPGISDQPVPIWPLAIPVAIAFLPLAFPGRSAMIFAATLMTAFSLITGFSIGEGYLLPAAVLWVGVWRARRRSLQPS